MVGWEIFSASAQRIFVRPTARVAAAHIATALPIAAAKPWLANSSKIICVMIYLLALNWPNTMFLGLLCFFGIIELRNGLRHSMLRRACTRALS